MKNNKGITLVALIITIIVMSIIIGITVSSGGGLLQKSKMTDYIGYMKLVKARADVKIEDDIFEGKTIEGLTYSFGESAVTNEIAKKGYYLNRYKKIKWNPDKIAEQGIDKNILGTTEYFVIVFDEDTMETVDVIYSTGCGYEGDRYYSLSDMETVIMGEIPTVASIKKIENLVSACGFEGTGWSVNGSTRIFDSSIKKSGNYSLKLLGKTTDWENTSESTELISPTIGHIYYISLYAKKEGTDKNIGFYLPLAEPSWVTSRTTKIEDGWTKYSVRGERLNYTAYYRDTLRVDNDNNYTENTIWVDELFIVDLTETFGAGKEPKIAWCDANLDYGVTEVVAPTN